MKSIRSALLMPGLLCVTLILSWGAAGCSHTTTSVATPRPPASDAEGAANIPAFASDEEAIRWLVEAESKGTVARDIDLLMSLWVADGVVADANHTPSDESDDLVWRGEYAIRDRYVTLVFPSVPDMVAPADLSITVNGDEAIATSTTHIGDEVSPEGDRWTFVRAPEGWRIESLTYNLERS